MQHRQRAHRMRWLSKWRALQCQQGAQFHHEELHLWQWPGNPAPALVGMWSRSCRRQRVLVRRRWTWSRWPSWLFARTRLSAPHSTWGPAWWESRRRLNWWRRQWRSVSCVSAAWSTSGTIQGRWRAESDPKCSAATWRSMSQRTWWTSRPCRWSSAEGLEDSTSLRRFSFSTNDLIIKIYCA